jgi:hypothetical protein
MKGGNTDSNAKAGELPGLERGDYAKFDMTGGKKKGKAKKSSSKFSDFDFEKEWKEFETSYNQKYGGAKKRKTSSTKKKPTKKASSTKKPAKKASAKKPKRKTQRGGDDPAATSAPAQFFDANATMSAPSSDQSKGSLMNGLYLHAPNNPVVDQTGGAKKKKASKAKKPKTATKTTKPKKDSKKDTKSTGKKVSVLDKIKKFFSM